MWLVLKSCLKFVLDILSDPICHIRVADASSKRITMGIREPPSSAFIYDVKIIFKIIYINLGAMEFKQDFPDYMHCIQRRQKGAELTRCMLSY
jgi:hypothetical protein